MEIPTKLLNLQQVGITVAKEFLLEQLILSSKKIFDPFLETSIVNHCNEKVYQKNPQPEHG